MKVRILRVSMLDVVRVMGGSSMYPRCVCGCVWARARACVTVCLCVRERERETMLLHDIPSIIR